MRLSDMSATEKAIRKVAIMGSSAMAMTTLIDLMAASATAIADGCHWPSGRDTILFGSKQFW